MTDDSQTSRATSAISEDWQVGLALWIVPTVLALFLVFGVGGMVAAAGSGFEGVLDVVARWTLSSSAHIDWSAPLLVTAAFALAAICAAPIQERVGFTSPMPVFSAAAATIAVVLSVWVVCALASLPRLSTLEAENPAVWDQFGSVSGVFLAAPLGVIAGLSAGRFQLLPLPARIAAARRQVERLDAEVAETSATVAGALTRHRDHRLAGYRLARYGVPFALAGVLVAVTTTALTAAQWPPASIPTIVISSLFVFVFSAFCAAVARSLLAAPSSYFSAPTATGRRPTVLGWISGALLVMGATTPLAVAAYLSSAVTLDAPEGTAAEWIALWTAALAPIIAAAVYGVALLLPVSARGHRAAAHRARARRLTLARDALARLEEQDAAGPAAAAGSS